MKVATFASGKAASSAVAELLPFFGKGRPVRFWAEGGLVMAEDTRDDIPETERVHAMSWRQAAERVLALSDMVIRSSEDPKWAHERARLQRFVCDMEDVIKIAKTQGDPTDANVVREMASRRPKSVVVPSRDASF